MREPCYLLNPPPSSQRCNRAFTQPPHKSQEPLLRFNNRPHRKETRVGKPAPAPCGKSRFSKPAAQMPHGPRCSGTHPAERAGAKLLKAAGAAEGKHRQSLGSPRTPPGAPPPAPHPRPPSLTRATQSQTGQHRVSSGLALPSP